MNVKEQKKIFNRKLSIVFEKISITNHSDFYHQHHHHSLVNFYN